MDADCKGVVDSERGQQRPAGIISESTEIEYNKGTNANNDTTQLSISRKSITLDSPLHMGIFCLHISSLLQMQTATLSDIRIEQNTTVFGGHCCTVHLTQCPARDGLGGVPENLPFHQITFGNGGVLLFPSAACKISDFGTGCNWG